MKKNTSVWNILISTIAEYAIKELFEITKGMIGSKTSIDIGEFDYDLWKRINRELFKLSPEKYSEIRVPTQNKQYYEMEVGGRLIIPLSHTTWTI